MVFCKAPEPGMVKTRLAASIGDESAAVIHRQLAHHCLQNINCITEMDLELWCSPSLDHPFFDDCSRRYNVRLKNQNGGDLGQRMHNAFTSVLATKSYAIVVGTDCPALDADYIHQARVMLENGCDSVIGPAEDGGYVLLGLRKAKYDYFDDIQWGSGAVLQATLQRLPLNTYKLDCLWDVDQVSDLNRLYEFAPYDL